MDINKIHNQDCLEAMRNMSDNQYDLAIVDPPYGIADNPSRHKGSGKLKNRFLNKNADKFAKWDKVPKKEYFDELFRVSKEQIIWGGNYFDLHATRGFLIWDKKQPFPNFSACEYAWLSFQVPSKIYEQAVTRIGENKIHPTQKPVKLYEWLLMNYAKEGDKILDTHLGSGSIAIACHNLGYDLTGYEIDKEYYDNAIKRIKNHQAQTRIF